MSLHKYANASAIYHRYMTSRKILRFITIQRYDPITNFLIDTRLAYLDRCANLLKLDEEYPEEDKQIKVINK